MDRRQKKTREAIFKAFTELLSEKNYNQISVQDIIDRADVGRTTFYSHFETKDYLLSALCEELFDHIIDYAVGQTSVNTHYDGCVGPSAVFLHLIYHLKNNDNNIIELLSCENNDLFLRYFKTNLQKLVRQQFVIGDGGAKTALPEDYLVNHIASSFVETVSWWLSRGEKETPEQLTEYFLAAIEPICELK